MPTETTTRRSGQTLREVVERLAPIERKPGSAGEEQAARWLADRLRAAGARDVVVEPAGYRPGYAPLIGAGTAIAAVAGIAALRRPGRHLPAALTGLAIGAGIADDTANGMRLLRRATAKRKATQNVVARIGPEDAPQTLVVLAHHDAAPTGFIFDQTLHHAAGERFPGIIERRDTAVPMWWPVFGGPLLVGAGALLGRRTLTAVGTVLAATAALTMADIARGRTVPGANDNLSACAVLVAIAERLAAEPADGLRVLLVSCGAEEVCQGGIYDFIEQHRHELPPERTSVLNLDTVGSPRLVMLEGEGTIRPSDYTAPEFRDLVADSAREAGIALRRGMRAMSSTDSVVTSRAGYATATLSSVDEHKALANYHLMSDTPENLDYEIVADALELTLAVARRLAARG